MIPATYHVTSHDSCWSCDLTWSIPPSPWTQHLDQLQSLELFQGFHYDAYRGSIADLKTKLGSKRETQRLLQQITEYYYSERLFVLRCLKHLLGYWQDSRHPYRVGGAGGWGYRKVVSYWVWFLVCHSSYRERMQLVWKKWTRMKSHWLRE